MSDPPTPAPRPDTAAAAPPRLFYGYVLAGYSFCILFLASSFFLHSRGIFFPLWREEFGVDRFQLSLLVSITLFTGNCLSPLVGFLIDRYAVRQVTLFGAVWLVIGYLLYQRVGDFAAFCAVLLVFQSIGWVCVGPLVHTKLMVNWFARHRGKALGIAFMGLSVAGIFMPLMATWLSTNFGWRGAYAAYAGVLLLVFIPFTALLVRESPADMGTLPDGDLQPAASPAAALVDDEHWRAVYRDFLSSRPFWSVIITFTLMSGVYSALVTHMPAYLTEELGYSLVDASYLLGVAGAMAIVGKVVFGWMMDEFSAKATVLVAVGSYMASALIFMTGADHAFLLLAAGLFGLAFGGMVPMRSVLISRIFGVARFSRANGLFALFLAPATFWVAVTGYIAETTGSYFAAFQIWAVGFALVALVTLLVRLPDRADAVDHRR